MADENSLGRLLRVLLDSAVKYTPAPGTIELRLEAQDGKALISVRDSGIGITIDDQARIFERFFRADKIRSRELGGAGIGLSIAEWIVQQHRGSIRVRSSAGVESTFFVELPPGASKKLCGAVLGIAAALGYLVSERISE